MKCPKCSNEIGNCKVCPFCNHKVEELENVIEQLKNEENSVKYKDKEINTKRKSDFLLIFQLLIVLIGVIGAIFMFANKNYLSAFYAILAVAISIIIIQIFKVIIDLLQSIEEKL